MTFSGVSLKVDADAAEMRRGGDSNDDHRSLVTDATDNPAGPDRRAVDIRENWTAGEPSPPHRVARAPAPGCELTTHVRLPAVDYLLLLGKQRTLSALIAAAELHLDAFGRSAPQAINEQR